MAPRKPKTEEMQAAVKQYNKGVSLRQAAKINNVRYNSVGAGLNTELTERKNSH